MEFRYKNEVKIPATDVVLEGRLVIPKDARSIIVFSHGSGSSRFSARNTMVASFLNRHQFGTLLFDLLTAVEDKQYENRFNIDLLTERLMSATYWLMDQEMAKDCRIGYFGASTGAASALRAAAKIPEVAAVVSRGGRPDLATDQLNEVRSPVLLIVGGKDKDVLSMNRDALKKMNCPKKLVIIEGATHLFEEPGCMEKVSEAAGAWFDDHMNEQTTF